VPRLPTRPAVSLAPPPRPWPPAWWRPRRPCGPRFSGTSGAGPRPQSRTCWLSEVLRPPQGAYGVGGTHRPHPRKIAQNLTAVAGETRGPWFLHPRYSWPMARGIPGHVLSPTQSRRGPSRRDQDLPGRPAADEPFVAPPARRALAEPTSATIGGKTAGAPPAQAVDNGREPADRGVRRGQPHQGAPRGAAIQSMNTSPLGLPGKPWASPRSGSRHDRPASRIPVSTARNVLVNDGPTDTAAGRFGGRDPAAGRALDPARSWTDGRVRAVVFRNPPRTFDTVHGIGRTGSPHSLGIGAVEGRRLARPTENPGQ